MLVIVNGAFKSGSTWLFNIVRLLTDFAPAPDSYLNPRWTLPDWRTNNSGEVWAFDPKKLESFLNTYDFKQHDFLAKNHLRKNTEKKLLINRPHVFLIDINRDVRDVVVSAFYHDRRVYGFKGNFEEYYWTLGRLRAIQVMKHRRVWNDSVKNIYISSFDRLKECFEEEVARIAEFLGIELTTSMLEKIKNETTIVRLRDKWGETNKKKQFFRKGESGEWMSHFNQKMLNDLKQITIPYIRSYEIFKMKLKALRHIPVFKILEKINQKALGKYKDTK